MAANRPAPPRPVSIDSNAALAKLTVMTEGTRPPAACLIGWPAAHSRSPLIHRYWLRTLGIEGGYVIEAVPPEDLRDFVLRLSLRGFVGANVTIPHKEDVLALSTPDARARAVGAANTLWFADGELRSTNTDVEGFINNLDASAKGWDANEDAVVLGAGWLVMLFFSSDVLLAVTLEVAFSYVAARATVRLARAGWLSAAVKLTWKPLLGAVVCAIVLGAAIDVFLPAATTLPQAVRIMLGGK